MWDWDRGGHLEGGVGSGKILDRGSNILSQYASRFQGRQSNRDHPPHSQAAPVAEIDKEGGYLKGLP